MYEYHDKIERVRATEISFEQEADKIEDEKMDETLAWIEEEEAKEEEARRLAEEEKWMLEQLKKENGDDFGDDIDIDFSE